MRRHKPPTPTITNPLEEKWFIKYWRPAIAWQYFAVCLCDFIIFPMVTLWWSTKIGQQWHWQPITLKEGGFYHMSMGVIIGVTAWQRGEEKQWQTRVFGPSMIERDRYSGNVESEQMYVDDDYDPEVTGDPPAHPDPHIR